MKKSYYEHYCDNIENVENYEAAKKKIAEARKGKHWKLVDGKRVLY